MRPSEPSPPPSAGSAGSDDGAHAAAEPGGWNDLGAAERSAEPRAPREERRSGAPSMFEFEWEVGQWWANGVVRQLRGLNSLAVPFLEDEPPEAEENYSLQPAPKPLGVPQLMGIAFFAVSGSAYGIEETVSVAGPFLTIVALLLTPLLWAYPMAMVVSELSTALPHSGGYIVWVNTAFGPMVSLLNGMSNMLCNVLDCALYPLLLTDYLQRTVLPLLPSPVQMLDDEHWLSVTHSSLLGNLIRVSLVALAALVNVLGVNVVGSAALLLMVVVCAPFIPLIFAAVSAPTFDLSRVFDSSPSLWPQTYGGWYLFATLVLWNTCGYDSAGMMAAEVSHGKLTYPRALSGTVCLTTTMYILPLAFCAAAVGNWGEWREGQFPKLAYELSGPLLSSILTAASIVAMVGVLCTLMCTTSRALLSMAQLRMLPASLSRLHSRFGTPWLAIIVNACMISIATVILEFDALLQLSMFFYAINVIMQCLALLRLRATHPHRLRPTTIIPFPVLCFPMAIALAILFLSPASHWLAAAVLLVATLAVYCCLAILKRPGGTASARALAIEIYHSARLGVLHADDEPPHDERRGTLPFLSRIFASYRQVPSSAETAAQAVQAFEMTALDLAEDARHDAAEQEPAQPGVRKRSALEEDVIIE